MRCCGKAQISLKIVRLQQPPLKSLVLHIQSTPQVVERLHDMFVGVLCDDPLTSKVSGTFASALRLAEPPWQILSTTLTKLGLNLENFTSNSIFELVYAEYVQPRLSFHAVLCHSPASSATALVPLPQHHFLASLHCSTLSL